MHAFKALHVSVIPKKAFYHPEEGILSSRHGENDALFTTVIYIATSHLQEWKCYSVEAAFTQSTKKLR